MAETRAIGRRGTLAAAAALLPGAMRGEAKAAPTSSPPTTSPPTTSPPTTSQAALRPVVLELSTSQGCSSCPPADDLLRTLAQTRNDVLALAFHITYWDRLGWRDPFALPASTARQRRYAGLSLVGGIYTPQLVVDGRADVVGSDRASVLATIAAARPAAALSLALSGDAQRLTVELGAGQGTGDLLLVGFDPEHRTAVGRGENAGRTLLEANVVRSVTPLGRWDGTANRLSVLTPEGARHAALVQAADGTYLAAALRP